MQEITIQKSNLAFRTREAYKTLRSNIEFSGKDIRVIAVTSCTPNEGKSEVSFELACSFAENNRKVLLIDADLRKSVMREHFKSGKVHYGLSNYLVGHCEFDEAVCATDLETRDILDDPSRVRAAKAIAILAPGNDRNRLGRCGLLLAAIVERHLAARLVGDSGDIPAGLGPVAPSVGIIVAVGFKGIARVAIGLVVILPSVFDHVVVGEHFAEIE